MVERVVAQIVEQIVDLQLPHNRATIAPQPCHNRIMNIHPDHIKAINQLIPKKDQQVFLDQAIEDGLKKYSFKKSTSQPSKNKDALEVFVDGGSRGNPGPSGGGFAVYRQGQLVMSGSEFFGEKTNNQSEYLALRAALRKAYDAFGDTTLHCFMDSKLAVEQVNGRYKVKSDKIKPLHQEIMRMITQFKDFKITHVRREQNQMADKLANEAMDRGGF